MNQYIDAFLSHKTWWAGTNDIALIGEVKMVVPYDFTSSFPQMSRLLEQAVKLEIVVTEKKKRAKSETYWLICWTKDDCICGWLCLPPKEKIEQALPERYRMVLKVFGGIVEAFGLDTEENLLLNMDSVLCLGDWSEDVAYCKDAYDECCEEENVKSKIEFKKLIVVAAEANGNLTFCHCESEEILLFAQDHAYTNVEIYDDCPEYTFYKIRECSTFQTWIEKIALQWLNG